MDVPGPRWELALGNRVVEVRGGEVLVLDCHFILLSGSEVLDALIGFEMIFDKVDLALGVDPLECVRAVSVHVSVAVRSASIREEDGHLVHGLGGVLPEIKDHVWICQVGGWVSLLAVDKVREFNRIIDEEHWGVVTDHIIVALLGVELDGESSWISLSVRGASLACDSRKSEEKRGLLTHFVEEVCSGVFGDIISNLKDTVSSRALGVHHSLWNSLSIEVSKFVNEMEVLEKDWASGASSHGVLVVVNRATSRGGQNFLFHILKI